MVKNSPKVIHKVDQGCFSPKPRPESRLKWIWMIQSYPGMPGFGWPAHTWVPCLRIIIVGFIYIDL